MIVVILLYLLFCLPLCCICNWPSGCWWSTLIIKNWIIIIIIIINIAVLLYHFCTGFPSFTPKFSKNTVCLQTLFYSHYKCHIVILHIHPTEQVFVQHEAFSPITISESVAPRYIPVSLYYNWLNHLVSQSPRTFNFLCQVLIFIISPHKFLKLLLNGAATPLRHTFCFFTATQACMVCWSVPQLLLCCRLQYLINVFLIWCSWYYS
jgi:hypothetical protein